MSVSEMLASILRTAQTVSELKLALKDRVLLGDL